MKHKTWLFSLLRIYLGVILLVTVYGKLTSTEPFSSELAGFVQRELTVKNPISSYSNFLQRTVLPHKQIFSYLIMTGELAAGLGLLFGIFTPLSALIAITLFLNYMLAKGRWFWSPDSEDAAVFFIAFVVCVSKAGRSIGIDYFFAKRRPNSLLW